MRIVTFTFELDTSYLLSQAVWLGLQKETSVNVDQSVKKAWFVFRWSPLAMGMGYKLHFCIKYSLA